MEYLSALIVWQQTQPARHEATIGSQIGVYETAGSGSLRCTSGEHFAQIPVAALSVMCRLEPPTA